MTNWHFLTTQLFCLLNFIRTISQFQNDAIFNIFVSAVQLFPLNLHLPRWVFCGPQNSFHDQQYFASTWIWEFDFPLHMYWQPAVARELLCRLHIRNSASHRKCSHPMKILHLCHIPNDRIHDFYRCLVPLTFCAISNYNLKCPVSSHSITNGCHPMDHAATSKCNQ